MSLLVLCHTLAVTYRYYDHLIVTDRDTYLEDILAGTVQMLYQPALIIMHWPSSGGRWT